MEETYVVERIKELLEKNGWSVYKLSQKCGLPTTTLYNMFERETVPGIATLLKIVQGFGLTMAQFFTEDEYPDLTERQRILPESFNCLDEERKCRLEAYLEGLRYSAR